MCTHDRPNSEDGFSMPVRNPVKITAFIFFLTSTEDFDNSVCDGWPGGDATQDFESVGHSTAAQGMMETYLVGVLEGFKGDITPIKKETTGAKQEKTAFKEIPASVVKDNESSFFTKLLQFLVPLLIVAVAFGIRSFLKESQTSS